MPFQSEVNVGLASGIPGEIIEDGPQRVQTLNINSSSPYPVFRVGYAYTRDGSNGYAYPGGQIGGGRTFAGILVNPKAYANFGYDDESLPPSLDVLRFTQGEFMTMGTIWVDLSGALPTVGDQVIYETDTGQLSNIHPGQAPYAGWTLVPNAVVVVAMSEISTNLSAIRLTN